MKRLLQLLRLNGHGRSARGAPTTFRPLPREALAHMERQRAFVASLLAEHLPAAQLTGRSADLVLLQQVLDARLLQPDQTWELQALGIVLGDALIDLVGGLAWVEVSDEYGTDPTLRYRNSTFHVNPLTMISKRVETGKPVDVRELTEQTAAFLRGLELPAGEHQG